MVKQRKDSVSQFDAAGRTDLSEKENAEIEVIQTFLPEALSEEEIVLQIKAAIAETGAANMQDMGR